MKIYIVGISGFIAKNLYLKIRKQFSLNKIYCLTHNEVDKLGIVSDDDVVINCSGVNRGLSDQDYIDGNFHFLETLIKSFNNKNPYLIHFSSFLVNGFDNIPSDQLSGYTKIFIDSKIMGETFLKNNYPLDKLCILRPSNVYGFNCEPYYNNILVSLIYESITDEHKITSLNKNCHRNFLGVDGLVDTIVDIMINKKVGTFNIVSNNTISLDKLVDMIYVDNCNNPPKKISIVDDDLSIPNSNLTDDTIIVAENLDEMILTTKEKMKKLIEIKNKCPIKKLSCLSQPRGNMVEVSDLVSSRLYTITITQNSFRGNHYHYEQIEEFYVSRGKVIFLLSHYNDLDTVFMCILQKRDIIRVNPYIVHTLVNDFIKHDSELFITSTQKYVPNVAVDTEYVNIL